MSDTETPKLPEPGTRVRTLIGPLGAVVWDRPHTFIDETFAAGYETDVSDVPCGVAGWVYLNTERDEVVIPISVGALEVIAQ